MTLSPRSFAALALLGATGLSATGLSISGAQAQVRTSPPSSRPLWQLPARSVAIYERQTSFERPPASLSLWGPFVREANPPLLFAEELTPDRRALREPIHDVRDLGRHAAFDLASFERAGSQRYYIALLNSLMPMRAELRFQAPESDGAQRARGTLRSLPPPAADDPEQGRYLTGDQGRLEGELELLRRFDRERGAVVHFDFAMALRWTPRNQGQNQAPHALAWRETWSLREVLRDEGPDRARASELVRGAIDRAAAALQQKLGPPVDPAMWPTRERATSAAGFSLGAVAGIALVALLHSGASIDEPLIAAAFERLRATEPLDACALATGILAFGARPAAERALSEADHALVATWTRALVEAAGKSADEVPLLWRDASGRSCSERAHLATRALGVAASCGIELPADLWPRVARHWLATQDGDGFACSTCEVEAGGSGTALALDALGLCRQILSRPSSNPALLRSVDAAIDGGWRWMEQHWTTRGQPGPLFQSQARRYHADWALTSAARARGIAAPFGRDLAWEIALHYVHALTPQDHWGRLEDDAMALLCLDAPPLPPTTPTTPGAGR